MNERIKRCKSTEILVTYLTLHHHWNAAKFQKDYWRFKTTLQVHTSRFGHDEKSTTNSIVEYNNIE